MPDPVFLRGETEQSACILIKNDTKFLTTNAQFYCFRVYIIDNRI